MVRNPKAFIFLHGDIFLVGSCSGPGACVQLDFESPVVSKYFNELTDKDIGFLVENAWKYCRDIPLREDDLTAEHMAIMNASNQKNLFKNTKFITIMKKNGSIYTGSTHQNRLGGFKGLKFQIRLPEQSDENAIGIAVRQALENSKTDY